LQLRTSRPADRSVARWSFHYDANVHTPPSPWRSKTVSNHRRFLSEAVNHTVTLMPTNLWVWTLTSSIVSKPYRAGRNRRGRDNRPPRRGA
jgi:hypothetical protein